jgi:hypothetical protein
VEGLTVGLLSIAVVGRVGRVLGLAGKKIYTYKNIIIFYDFIHQSNSPGSGGAFTEIVGASFSIFV